MYVPVVILSTHDDNSFLKQLKSGFKRTIKWDKDIKNKTIKKYFISRGEINNNNVLIDGRNVYDQPINDLIKQHDEVRKVSAAQGDDFTAGCLLDYAYFKDN